MIFPILNGVVKFSLAPVTWLLVVINLFVWYATEPYQKATRERLDKFYDGEQIIQAQGEIFADFISQNPTHYEGLLLDISDKALNGHEYQKELLGKIALRDRFFVENVLSSEFRGDQVLAREWKSKYLEIRDVMNEDPVNTWGLNYKNSSLSRWFTYQFLHGGFLHVVSNMAFLILFGSLLEPAIGSLAFLVVYLLSGFLAAGTFVELSGISAISLVGASGSVSGIMGAIVAYYWRERLKFGYLVLFVKGYYGYLWLPSWTLLLVWGVSDVAGLLSTVREVGGIAYAAHVGGALHGMLFGFCLRIWSKSSAHRVLSHASRL